MPHHISPKRQHTILKFTASCAVAFLLTAFVACRGTSPQSPSAAPAPMPFLLGADISNLSAGRPTTRASTQAARVTRRPNIFQENGKTDTELNIMMNHKWNAFRLRVFVDPVRAAPNNTLANTIVLAKQIKSAGAIFLLDIHYSDTWADPQHQETPVAWRSLDADEMETKVEQYTADIITQLKNNNAMPDMVQVGNEITGGMLWPLGHVQVPHSDIKIYSGKIQPLPTPYDDAKQWSNLIRFIKAGVRGVRSASANPLPKIVIHIDSGGDWPITKWYFDHLTESHVDYDIIGQSFYPSTHGTPALLQQNIINCAAAYHKPFMVAETGYSKTGGDQLLSRGKYNLWPGTPRGQLQFMADIINTTKAQPSGLGVFYWAPEGALWNQDGSPAPAISVLAHLATLTTRPSSHLPDEVHP